MHVDSVLVDSSSAAFNETSAVCFLLTIVSVISIDTVVVVDLSHTSACNALSSRVRCIYCIQISGGVNNLYSVRVGIVYIQCTCTSIMFVLYILL